MSFNKTLGLAISILVFTLTLLEDVNAASISVKCERRGTTRSKISVDGYGLTGAFFAVVYSPPGTAIRSKVNQTADSSHEVEFDFDSYPPDIAAGATKISPAFIKNNTVYGYIRRAKDGVPVGSMKATCSVK